MYDDLDEMSEQEMVEKSLICEFCGHKPHGKTPCPARHTHGPLHNHPCNCVGK